MSIVYVNGKYVPRNRAVIGVEDRAACFGDGIYEVMLIKQGVMINEQEHEARLARSLTGLQIDAPMRWNAIRLIIQRLLRLNRLQQRDAVMYLQISRGEAKRDHAFPAHAAPSLFIAVSPAKYMVQSFYEEGATAITAEDIRWMKRDIKSISLLPNVLAKQKAVNENVQETILIEPDGTVTEGSSSNLFIVNKAGELQTHPADNHILGGITRKNVLKVAREHNMPIREERFDHSVLKQAKEVFITSTTKHVLPITFIDGVPVNKGKVGEVTKQLIKGYKVFVEMQKEEQCKHA